MFSSGSLQQTISSGSRGASVGSCQAWAGNEVCFYDRIGGGGLGGCAYSIVTKPCPILSASGNFLEGKCTNERPATGVGSSGGYSCVCG